MEPPSHRLSEPGESFSEAATMSDSSEGSPTQALLS